MGIAVDANVINAFLKAQIDEDENALVYRLIECIRRGPGLSIDFDGKMKHQWMETCNSVLFGAWFEQQIQAGTIRAVDQKLPEQHKKYLRLQLGFPYSNRYEGIYIEVAHVTEEKMIVSEDIDFWSPEDKLSGADRRAKVMSRSSGMVCKYLANKLAISVMTVSQAFKALGCAENQEV